MTKEESMDEFSTCVLNLVNECDRHFENTHLKVATYTLSTLKSCTASLQLLENAMKNNNCVSHDKITKTLSLMLKLMNIWSKHSEYLQSNSKSSKFSMYNLTTTHNDRAGPASYEIDVEQVKLLRGYYFKWKSIAKIFGIHRTILWKRIKDCEERTIIGILRAKGVSVQ